MYKIGILIFLVTAFACGHSSEEADLHQDDLHLHGEESSRATLFAGNTEFYVEHAPLETGEESAFLVHLTNLKSYKPYLSGTVSIQLDGVTASSDLPVSPGIFEIPFVPARGGEFEISYTFTSEGSATTVSDHVLVLQEQPGSPEQAGDSHAGLNEVEPGEITFTKEQAWKSPFMVERIEPVPFYAVLPTSGEILAVPGEKKSVAASGRGIVHFLNTDLVQGSPVTRGQVLFTLQSETMIENNVELQYRESLNNYEKSRSDYERHALLFAQGVISERQFIETRARFTSDSLRFSSLAANTSGSGLNVYAPVSGTIHELNVSEGGYIETGELMVTISANRKLLIRADLSQQFYGQIGMIESANFRPAYTDRVYSIEEVNGRLLAAGSSVAENDHYLPVIFEVENDGSLLEGAFTEVFLKTSPKQDVIVLPYEAVSEEQGGHFVYVQVTGESFTKRAVTPGNSDGRLVEIALGLEPGERVVTRGVMLLKASSMVTTVAGDGHNH